MLCCRGCAIWWKGGWLHMQVIVLGVDAQVRQGSIAIRSQSASRPRTAVGLTGIPGRSTPHHSPERRRSFSLQFMLALALWQRYAENRKQNAASFVFFLRPSRFADQNSASYAFLPPIYLLSKVGKKKVRFIFYIRSTDRGRKETLIVVLCVAKANH
jgi:hypothetical protein